MVEPIDDAGPKPQESTVGRRSYNLSFGGIVNPAWQQRDQDEVQREMEAALEVDHIAALGATGVLEQRSMTTGPADRALRTLHYRETMSPTIVC